MVPGDHCPLLPATFDNFPMHFSVCGGNQKEKRSKDIARVRVTAPYSHRLRNKTSDGWTRTRSIHCVGLGAGTATSW